MKRQDQLLWALTTVALVLSVPYALVKTGAWRPAVSNASASDPATGLPIRGPDDLPIICELADFSMTNQLGQTVRRADLLGQVWVADVIFTRCPGPCATMTAHLADLQASIPKDWPVKLVSLTTDPEYDTPDVLHTYAEEYHADPGRWSFLHAAKPAMVDLAVKNLKLVVLDKEQERESPNDLFIHSTTLALVDKHGRLRGALESVPMDLSEDPQYAGAGPVPPETWENTMKPRLIKAIERLIAED